MKSVKILVVVLFCVFGQALGQTGTRPQVTPFVAEFEKEKHQLLPDGNAIDKVERGPYYRDRYGRTRVEVGDVIVISDPVAGTSYIIDVQKKVARLMDHKSLRAQATQVRTAENKIADPTAFVNAQSPGKAGATALESPAFDKRSLGSKTIEGVTCEGRAFSYTVPANSKLGNNRPLKSSSEIWFAKELLLPIMSINEDPLMGKTVQRYKNIKIGVDPDPALFRVPEGFKVVDK